MELQLPVDLLAFYTNDGKVVFLQFSSSIVLLQKRSLKMAGQL